MALTRRNLSAVAVAMGLLVGVTIGWATNRQNAFPEATVEQAKRDHIRDADARFKTTCRFHHRAADDPIVFPNQPGLSHMHDFFGSTIVNASTTTYAQLLSGGTTCNDRDDKAGYWSPTVMINGQPRDAVRITAYYRRGNKHGTIEPYPDGLKVIAGWEMGNPTPPPLEHANWHCGHGDYPEPKLTATNAICSEPGGWSMQIRFPDCWVGGTVTDSANHRSHMAYSVHDDAAAANVCPPSHPVPVPQLEVNVNFGQPSNGASITGLSSGGYGTIHADFFNGWQRARLIERITTCLNGIQVCESGG